MSLSIFIKHHNHVQEASIIITIQASKNSSITSILTVCNISRDHHRVHLRNRHSLSIKFISSSCCWVFLKNQLRSFIKISGKFPWAPAALARRRRPEQWFRRLSIWIHFSPRCYVAPPYWFASHLFTCLCSEICHIHQYLTQSKVVHIILWNSKVLASSALSTQGA